MIGVAALAMWMSFPSMQSWATCAPVMIMLREPITPTPARSSCAAVKGTGVETAWGAFAGVPA